MNSVTFKIASNSFREYLNSKISAFFITFGAILVYSGALFGVMAVDQEKRTLVNFGLAIAELGVFSFSVFWASFAVQREMETKTIYLILSRPVSRAQYLAGKLLGIFFASAFVYAGVIVMQMVLLVSKGYSPDAVYFCAVLFSFLKIILIASVSLLAASLTTSSFSSILVSVMVWIAGHFSGEVSYLVDKTHGTAKIFLKTVFYLLPNFQLFNLRDTLSFDGVGFGRVFAYFFCYLTALYFLNVMAFRKKEF